MTDNAIRGCLCAWLLLVAGCSSQQQGDVAADAPDAMESAAPAAAVAADAAAAPGSGTPPSALASSALSYEDGTRQFIRTARVAFEVSDVYRSALAIEDLVGAHGGFVVRNEIASDVGRTRRHPRGNGRALELAEYVTRGTLEVRVPGARTQAFLRALAREIVFLDQRTFEARDARFEILREALAYQRNQAAQASLGDVASAGGKPGARADVLSAQADARAGRDAAQVARLEFEDRVAFATLELAMHQPPRLRSTEVVDVDDALRRAGPGFLARAAQSLAAGWSGLLDVLVWMLAAWPLWLAILGAAATYGGLRRLRRRQDVRGG